MEEVKAGISNGKIRTLIFLIFNQYNRNLFKIITPTMYMNMHVMYISYKCI